MELALRIEAANGETPVWSVQEQALYWIDIKRPSLHRFDPNTGEDRAWPMPCEIGAFALARSGKVVAALRNGIAMFDPVTGELSRLADPPYDPRTHRFNDGKCDARGRFWIGTMHEPPLGAEPASPSQAPGPLCVFELDRGLRTVPRVAAGIGNGLAFSPDSRSLYYSHTEHRTVFRHSFDLERGELGPAEVFVRFADGKPDGAAVDESGFYWCALWGAGKIVRVSPDGDVEREIALPVSQVSMCGFGGPELDELYVTSARHGLDETELSREPLAGSVFRHRPGVRGRPPELFAG